MSGGLRIVTKSCSVVNEKSLTYRMTMPHTHLTIATLRATHSPHIGDLDCTVLIAHVLHTDRAFVLAHPNLSLLPSHSKRIASLCHRRATGYPLAYLTGVKEFYGRDFHVTPHTLIPRPETESLIDHAYDICTSLPRHARSLLVDIGTGSGAIIITLAHRLHDMHNITLLATDISPQTLRVARRNSRTHDVTHHMTFIHSDLLTARHLRTHITAHNPTHLILVANLPYVDDTARTALFAVAASCALRHEPQQALWSPDGGLHHYKRLIDHTHHLATNLPQTNIISLYELDPTQIPAMKHRLAPRPCHILHDLSNVPRFCRWDIVAQ